MSQGGMHYFQLLTRDEQRAAIVRLAASGASEYTIAAASRLSVEMIRVILGEQRALDEQAA
jgi:hypothetical protein